MQRNKTVIIYVSKYYVISKPEQRSHTCCSIWIHVTSSDISGHNHEHQQLCWTGHLLFPWLYQSSISQGQKTYRITLTGGNWQKWKRVFLTCPCHEIYRDEAVGLKSCKNTWKKLRYLWKCEIWGNIVKIGYFVNNCLIKAWILKILLRTCDKYNYNYLKYSTFRLNFIDFQLYIDFPFQFCVFLP